MGKYGRPKLSEKERRTALTLNVRLNAGEREIVERKAREASVTPTEWARLAALEQSPPARRVIPEINREAWLDLARLVATLNTALGRFRSGETDEWARLIEPLRGELALIRYRLIGNDGGGEE
jgi:DNA-binding response OmpR family regulator